MFAGLRNHPNKTVIIGSAVFLVGSVPQWFGAVWPLFTTKTIPQWLAERSWPGMTPALTGWLTAVLGVAILGMACAVFLATRKPAEPQRRPPSGFGVTAKPVVGNPRLTLSPMPLEDEVDALAMVEFAKLNEPEIQELRRLLIARQLPSTETLRGIEQRTPFARHTFAGHFELNEQFAEWLLLRFGLTAQPKSEPSRRLSADQRRDLVRRLRNHAMPSSPRVLVGFHPAAPDGFDFASELAGAFTEAGWSVDPPTVYTGIRSINASGVWVAGATPELRSLVLDALEAVGIAARYEQWVKEGEVRIPLIVNASSGDRERQFR